MDLTTTNLRAQYGFDTWLSYRTHTYEVQGGKVCGRMIILVLLLPPVLQLGSARRVDGKYIYTVRTPCFLPVLPLRSAVCIPQAAQLYQELNAPSSILRHTTGAVARLHRLMPNLSSSHGVQAKIGRGWASVLNTHMSSGIRSSFRNNK